MNDPVTKIGGEEGNPNNVDMDDSADDGNDKAKRCKRQKSPMKLQ